jgi:hypothetical protein
VLAGLLAAIVAFGIAAAAIPGTDGIISACLNTADGSIRLIDVQAGATCNAGEKLISWNKTGPTGPAGLKGSTGPAGPAGQRGPTGAAGLKGSTGPAGLKGSTGPAGPAGPKGATGPAGLKGSTGPAGLKGSTGPAGPAGPKGSTGPAGPRGATGPAGGPPGPTGPSGTTGPVGPAAVTVIKNAIGGVGLTYTGGAANGSAPLFVGGGPSSKARIDLTSTKTVFASITAGLGSTDTTNPIDFDYEACWSQYGTNTPQFFDIANYISVRAPANTTLPFSTMLSTTLPAGSYEIGMCVRNWGPATLDRNDWVNGTVMVF